MSIEDELQQFISSEVIMDDPNTRIGFDDSLISSGRVDSMGLLQVLGFIQQHYSVDLVSVGGPKDFETITSLASAIRRARRGE